MSIMIDAEKLYQVGELRVRCACGWDSDGKLVLVDRYSTDFPPVPRGRNPSTWYEFYRDSGGDPDDRISECPACNAELDSTTVIEASTATATTELVETVEEVDAEPEETDPFLIPRRSMVLISTPRSLPVQVSIEWLLRVLPEAPAQQIKDAVLVMITTPDAKLAMVLKNEAEIGEDLEVHTAALG